MVSCTKTNKYYYNNQVKALLYEPCSSLYHLTTDLFISSKAFGDLKLKQSSSMFSFNASKDVTVVRSRLLLSSESAFQTIEKHLSLSALPEVHI